MNGIDEFDDLPSEENGAGTRMTLQELEESTEKLCQHAQAVATAALAVANGTRAALDHAHAHAHGQYARLIADTLYISAESVTHLAHHLLDHLRQP